MLAPARCFGGVSLTFVPLVQVKLDDGILSVPSVMVEPLREEYIATGRLTVVQAQCLVERWGK
jgi:hypothetical protein